ncbi:type VI secretion system lipoprotein TssJ [Pectobacterium aroidearum]|uniref:Type VI secretion system lipoprotein TssJ n=2 Tax=Pectobacterium TaxID=122277 RepID=A0AAW3T098_9GAMM|nr:MULTISPECIES: type VI secretion system lipoprotein TssJ [Pectobacterium]ACT14269.1 type VI secretion lipoprotein, VC_A0113 family [Pectobacterium carotovorum subsp. carotovorum PC1]MBA0206282.1 type VI secretion system lipoprotein TssJ [Pectobacterium aroidearum]MBA5201494.1 type VI secretion system lipoprotein TssJ [Pectobacterium aroidearum]MBA5205962.1 type VI secretion system lipoprotein TssJ [Pectobacterium aroidearum]MBA5229764.1 type VI secretion system lipoprotein TssJ [Pectobacteri
MLRALCLCSLMFVLSGCTTLGKMAQVAANPDIQVGSNNHQPSTVGFSLLAEPDVNPNDSGEAAPIEFQLVLLAEDSRLLATDYDQVTTDIEKALAKNYINHQDYTLLPGQFKYLPPEALDEKVHYLGVIARYADSESSEWRKVIKLKNTGQTYQILVHLRRDEVEIKKDQEEE